MLIGTYETHQLADAFPLMAEFRLGTLAESISVNGLRNKPVLFEGKILDGRNRCLALVKLGLPIEFEDFTGTFDEALQYVLDHNLQRRDLEVTERILAEKRLERIRSLHRKLTGDNKRQSKLKLNDPESVKADALARREGCAELVQAMDDGLISEPQWAAELSGLPEDEQRRHVAMLRKAQEAAPRRAAREARVSTAWVVRDMDGTIDSVWTDGEKAKQTSKELTEQLGCRWVALEFALNEVDGGMEVAA